VLSGAAYEPFGPVSGWTWGNSTTASRSYDLDGKVAGVSSAGTKAFTYDDAFRVTGITDTATGSANWTYGYDAVDRLSSAVSGAATHGWSYDANGNRLAETGTAASSYTVSSTSNRLNGTTGVLNRAYSYDAVGNVLSDGAATTTYDPRGRLATLTQGGSTSTYTYNALGERIARSGGALGTVLFWYDEAGHLIGEYDGSGNLIQETVWLGDIPVATLRPGSPVAIYYVHTDHLNTPRQVTRPSDNAQMWTWFSDPFGASGPNENPAGAGVFKYQLRFPGQYFDAESGRHYNYFRDYDAVTGRYVESDPIGLNGGINTYGYARANPLRYLDALGLSACSDLVDALTSLWAIAPSSRELGSQMLDRRNTTLDAYDGFKPDLVAGGQGGDVSRHIYGHGGAVLAYPLGPGLGVSLLEQTVDYLQRFQEGRTDAESSAEIAGDRAARQVAQSLNGAMRQRLAEEEALGGCMDTRPMAADLKSLLESILCTD
jgi:RHS repeat-associated protein